MFELGQLRSFVAVATELHFGKAAKRLNMTQPPLSRQIQMLERELDVALLTRTSRSVELTSAGRAFLAEARDLLGRSEAAVEVARRASGEASGSVAVGFTGSTTYGFLPRLAARLRRDLPGVEVRYHEATSAEQVEALATGRIDLGLVRPIPAASHLCSACVAREALALALPLDHPLAGRRRPVLEQLQGEPFIMYSTAGPYMHSLLTAAFLAARIQPQIVQSMAQAQGILSLVSVGLGLAIVPDETRNACFDNVVFRPIKLGSASFAELQAVWHRDNKNPVLPLLKGHMSLLDA